MLIMHRIEMKCHYCWKVFTTKYNLNRHIQNVHEDPTDGSDSSEHSHVGSLDTNDVLSHIITLLREIQNVLKTHQGRLEQLYRDKSTN